MFLGAELGEDVASGVPDQSAAAADKV